MTVIQVSYQDIVVYGSSKGLAYQYRCVCFMDSQPDEVLFSSDMEELRNAMFGQHGKYEMSTTRIEPRLPGRIIAFLNYRHIDESKYNLVLRVGK